jgi:UPF0755 protein
MLFKNKAISAIILIVVILVGWLSFSGYQLWYSWPNNSPTGEYTIKVTKGQQLSDVAEKLEQDKVISSKDIILLQAKINPIRNLLSAEYKIKVPTTSQDILNQIDDQTKFKLDELAKIPKLPTVKVTIREGLNIDQMAAILEEKGVIKASEFQAFAKNYKNFNKTDYPFLPEPLKCEYGNLKNCAKYYPEGYLYPDTYDFFQPTSVEKVFNTFLDNFYNKVWTKLENQAKGKDFSKIVIMASVMEKESGRNKGIKDDAMLAELNKERKIIAGVFYNRIEQGMKWQSDVTAEYGYGKKVCQQTFKLEGCIFLDDELANTKYNTYLISGYPIGPVTNPQYFNIEAALNPDQNDFIYFVADVTGKKYFGKTEADQQKIINQVNKINRDLGL